MKNVSDCNWMRIASNMKNKLIPIIVRWHCFNARLGTCSSFFPSSDRLYCFKTFSCSKCVGKYLHSVHYKFISEWRIFFFRQRFPPSTQRAGKPPRPLENVFNFGNLLLNEEMYRYETDGGCTVLAEEQNTHSTEHYFTRTNKSGTIFRVHSGWCWVCKLPVICQTMINWVNLTLLLI